MASTLAKQARRELQIAKAHRLLRHQHVFERARISWDVPLLDVVHDPLLRNRPPRAIDHQPGFLLFFLEYLAILHELLWHGGNVHALVAQISQMLFHVGCLYF